MDLVSRGHGHLGARMSSWGGRERRAPQTVLQCLGHWQVCAGGVKKKKKKLPKDWLHTSGFTGSKLTVTFLSPPLPLCPPYVSADTYPQGRTSRHAG